VPGQPCAGETQIFDADTWVPSNNGNGKGSWTSGRREVAPDLPPLEAAAGETALAGRVYALSGNPLHNVSLQIGERITRTDNTGRFLLSGIASGRQVLTIQGHTAGKSGKQYGTFDVLVDVVAGKTTALSYKIWLPVLDEQNAVTLPIPTHRELGVTTPNIPGMEVRVPSSSVLRMPPGAHRSHGMSRRELTSVAITPVPADRTPFPLPQGINDALVFTLQLHGAHVEGLNGEKRLGMRIVYPNYQNLPAGDRVEFWNYEPAGTGWYMYGRGTVTPDRRQVIPDAGVELQNMHCISLMNKMDAPASGPTDGSSDGDPVDLGTGLFVYNKTDLVLPDVLPITLSRTYRQSDSIERSFGKGMTNPYDIYMSGNTATIGEIILPDGGRIRFDVVSQQQWPYTYICTTSPTRFYKATMTLVPEGGPNGAWQVTLTDGTVYQFGIKVLFGDIFGPHHSITGLTSIKDRYGNKLIITRDNDFRLSRVTSPNGRWVQFSYSDSSKRIAQATDNTGRSIGYTYDANGRLWKVTDAKGGVTEYLYDSSDRMLTIKNPRNIVYLTNQYDAASGRITQQTLADDGIYQFAYTVNGQGKITQTDVTDPRTHVRRTTFNADSFSTSDIFALGTAKQQTYTYERQAGSNFMLSVLDPLNRRTAMTYDTLGNVTSVTRLAGTEDAVTTDITYEPVFNEIATITDPLDHTTTFDYDANGLLESLTGPLNNETSFTYNPAGQMLTATDPLDRTVQFAYDAGDLVSVTDALDRTVTRYVDAAGRVIRSTNALGETTRYEFDAVNQPSQVTNASGGITAISHDANGNILSFTDARNGVTSYVYDEMDRVVTKRDPLLHDESYEYDANGNLAQVTDRKNQVTTFAYDALDRVTQVSYADSSTVAYTYDSVSRITQVVDSVGGTTTFGYDNLDRLTSRATAQGNITYSYDDGGRLTSMTVAGQPTVNYTYDNGDRLTQITQGTQTVTIAYDDIGRRTSLTLPNSLVTEYGYDLASHLTSLTYKHNGNVLGNLTYDYDAAGRRTKMAGSFARSVSPQPVTSATYNAANQQLTFDGRTLTYDLNGNLTSDGENTYTWDARDRLAQVNGPELNASFQFGAAVGRNSKTVNGVSTSFLHSGDTVVQEQSSQSGTTNIVSGGIDEMFWRSDSGGVYSPLLDGLGSSLSLVDASGAIQTEYSYGAFGQAASSGASANNSSQYTGRDNEGAGLQYNRARYYSPALQRFISEDPIGLLGGDNQYAYVGNDPISFNDPSGLQDGPVNYLRDPFSADHWILNGGSNTISDILWLDNFAEWAWILGDHCRPAGDRMWAGAKIVGGGVIVAGGGLIAKGIGKGLSAGFKAARGARPVAPELLLDTNVVVSHGKQLLESGANIVKASVTDLELAAIVRQGKVGMPKAASQIASVADSVNVHLRINVRAGLTNKATGNFVDGIIGATAIERGSILVTADRALTRAVQALGGAVTTP
jgi:RHS repeat-associated protein